MNDLWETPQDLFDRLNGEFLFDRDAACLPETAKCDKFWTPEDDALTKKWHPNETIWLNPPYSRGNIDKFMEKAAKVPSLVVCLVRFDPSTTWFQKYVDGIAEEVRMLARRPKFVGAPSAYNFPCCIVVYDDRDRARKFDGTDYWIWDWKE